MTGTLGQSFNILFVDAQPADVELLPGKPLLIATGEVGTATDGLIITVTGFSSRFADEIELQPRFPGDIRPDR